MMPSATTILPASSLEQMELFAPPSGDVIWYAGRSGQPKTAAVKAQCWYSARHKAAAALNCEVGEVELEQRWK